MPVRDVDAFSGMLPRGVTVTANRGVNGIDGIVATAAGHARGWRDGPAALLIGDLAFLHDLGSLRAARSTPLTVVVINNGGGHIFDFLPIAAHRPVFEEFFLTPQHANLDEICGGLGIEHRRVTSLAGLQRQFQRSISEAGFEVLEVQIPGENNRECHERFHQAVVERVS
ncbi:MAG: thiamine pyrophosphate-binding protein [Myxococcota bacterium]